MAARTKQQQITGIRLEVLPDPNEPTERAIPDLFVLSEFEVFAAPLAAHDEAVENPRQLRLQHAMLPHVGRVESVMPLIDHDATSYWHVGPKPGEPGVVIFETTQNRIAAWQSWCRAMFCLNEFFYVD